MLAHSRSRSNASYIGAVAAEVTLVGFIQCLRQSVTFDLSETWTQVNKIQKPP